MGLLTVMLGEAKHLIRAAKRPFAGAQGDNRKTLAVDDSNLIFSFNGSKMVPYQSRPGEDNAQLVDQERTRRSGRKAAGKSKGAPPVSPGGAYGDIGGGGAT